MPSASSAARPSPARAASDSARPAATTAVRIGASAAGSVSARQVRANPTQRRAPQADLIHPDTLRDEGRITLAPSPPPRAGEAMRRVHELAQRAAAGTINYEIVTRIGPRVPRRQVSE